MENTNQKKYEKPKMEITNINAEDIITTSGDTIVGGTTDFLPDWLSEWLNS